MGKAPKVTSGLRPDKADGPHAVISTQQVADLWERGYAVIPRSLFGRDPYAIADAIKRPGMAQQWGDKPRKAEYLAQGWRMVVNEAWPGLFSPYGAVGDVEVDGLILMQKPQHEVDRVHAQNHAQAQKNVDDWIDRQRAAGFSVEIMQNVSTDSDAVGPDPSLSEAANNGGMILHKKDGIPTVDTTVGIPRDMMPYVSEILKERDRLCEECVAGSHDDLVDQYDAALKANPQAPKWPTLRAIAMPKAIANVRAKLKAQEGATDGSEAEDTTQHADGNSDRSGQSADDTAGSSGDDPALDAAGTGGAPAPAADSGGSAAPGASADTGDAQGHEPPTGA